MITTGLASFHHTNTQLKLQELAEPICSLSLAPGKNQRTCHLTYCREPVALCHFILAIKVNDSSFSSLKEHTSILE